MTGNAPEPALSGLRVLELGGGIAASYATKMLADYGADVIKVEPVEGDGARRTGPFPNHEPHSEKSGLFLHLNTNKRGVTLDLENPAAPRLLRRFAPVCDAIVESFMPGRMASLGLSYDNLRSINPRCVLTSITPFGQDGPRHGWHATEMVLFAMSGRMYGHGRQDREPLRYAPDLVCFQAGSTAAAATVAALWGAQLTGSGAWIDLSIQEAMVGNVDSRVVMAAYSRASGGRTYRVQEYPRGAYPCKDGFVLFGAGSDRYFRRVCHTIGRTDLLDDPRWASPESRPAHRDEWEAVFLDWLVDRTRREAFVACQAEGVLCAPILTMDEVCRDPQYASRGYFRRFPHPLAGERVLPGAPFILPHAPWSVRIPAPVLGQHTDEVYRGLLGYSAGELEEMQRDGVIR